MAKLIIRVPNWLGDAVMSTAAVHAFRDANPHDQISLIGLPLTLSVFQNTPYEYQLIPFDRHGKDFGWSGLLRKSSDLRQYQFDEAWLLTNSFSSALMVWLGRIPKRVGYSKSIRNPLLTQKIEKPVGTIHQVDRYAHLLLSECPDYLQPKIFLIEDEIQQARTLLKQLSIAQNQKVISMAIGAAYGPAKRWYPERFGELSKRCYQEYGFVTLILGSKQEHGLARKMLDTAGTAAIDLTGKTNLRETFALLHLSQLSVSNDSGLMHCSNALDTPVIALFGPTKSDETCPYNPPYQLINKHLDCAPCMKRRCPLKHHDCMRQITVDEVFEQVKAFI